MIQVPKGNMMADARSEGTMASFKAQEQKNESVMSQIHCQNCTTIKLSSIGGGVTRKYRTLRAPRASFMSQKNSECVLLRERLGSPVIAVVSKKNVS